MPTKTGQDPDVCCVVSDDDDVEVTTDQRAFCHTGINAASRRHADNAAPGRLSDYCRARVDLTIPVTHVMLSLAGYTWGRTANNGTEK